MLKPKITIKVTDKTDSLKKALKQFKTAYVTVGVAPGAGEYADGTSVADVALWNEFGTSKIPERSFIRSTLHEHQTQINAWRSSLVEQVLESRMTVHKALDILGFKIRELIRAKINSNIPPPNAPSTIAHKKREGVPPRTLMETGLLARSIEYKVVVGGSK